MPKKNTPARSTELVSIDYNVQDYVIVPAYDPGEFRPKREITPGDVVSQLINKPLTYFVRVNRKRYDLYVAVVAGGFTTIIDPSIRMTGSTYFLRLPMIPAPLEPSLKVIYLRFQDIPKPIGFKVPSISVMVVPVTDGGVGGEEGTKSTTVDYEDADEEILP